MISVKIGDIVSKEGLKLLKLPEHFLSEIRLEGLHIDSDSNSFRYILSFNNHDQSRDYYQIVKRNSHNLRDLSKILEIMKGCDIDQVIPKFQSSNSKYFEEIPVPSGLDRDFDLNVEISFTIQNPHTNNRDLYKSEFWFEGKSGGKDGVSTLEFSSWYWTTDFLGRILFSQLSVLVLENFKTQREIKGILANLLKRSSEPTEPRIVIYTDPRIGYFMSRSKQSISRLV